MQNKVLITTLSIIGLLFGFIGLVLSFLPLGTIDLIPAFVGLLFGLCCYFLAKKSGIRKKLITTVILISLAAILISVFTLLFVKNKVAEDEVFEEKIEQSAEEAVEDLEEAFEDLEELEDEE